jgi:NAD(P)-dependent dehydrogenase (short-subunit alcohol dehydrogenase family)
MKTVLISGANRGIGLEHAQRYAAAGAHVIAAVRDTASSDLKALGANVDIIAYDAADPAAPTAVKKAIGDRPIDLLFNNAGIYGGDKQSFGSVDPDAFAEVIQINTLAPLLMAQALIDNVAASERKIIANQSSLMGSIADNGAGGYHAYRASKAALNMLTKGLANDLRSRGVTVVTLHPGWVKTRMGGPNAPVTTADCAAGQQKILAALTPAQSGKFFNYDGKELPW